MTLREKLATEPDEWTHPRRARVVPAVAAGFGAIVGASGFVSAGDVPSAVAVGLGAAVGYLAGYVLAAATD